MQVDPSKRLGSGINGVETVKAHPWFLKYVDWAKIEARTFPAPMVPTFKDPLDTSNFDDFDDMEGVQVPTLNGPDKNAAYWGTLWDWIDEQPKANGKGGAGQPQLARSSAMKSNRLQHSSTYKRRGEREGEDDEEEEGDDS